MRYFMLFFNFLLLYDFLGAQTVTIHKKDAVVWARQQVISGEIDTLVSGAGVLDVNGGAIALSVQQPENTFEASVVLQEGENVIVARFDNATSDTLRLTLGFKLKPEVYAYASVSGRELTLHASVIENPDGADLSFAWQAAADNPEPVQLANANDATASATLSETALPGEYYFRVEVVEAGGDTVTAETFITADENGLRAFDIKHDHAAWIDRAIIYEITPYNFVFAGKFRDITSKLVEIAELGINTIWLQPVYKTQNRGQGYDLIDYFAIRPDYGTEDDLRQLIRTAKELGLRVMFDFVPGHTSIDHPYAKDASQYGTDSHYHNYYAPIKNGVRYAMHYNKRTRGEVTFTYYFWEDLPMLNYDNPEVQRMMIEAGKLWIEKFDIDGYRVDAVWGANARNPEFAKKWRLALKRIKPDVFLLAEDKATDPTGVVFDERFDAAYDWFPEETWVSHWVWQTFFSTSSNPTIFNNNNENQRAALLRNSLTNNGNGYHPNAKILRFMENNDTFRFIKSHGVSRTKMAAALMFSLHGIPLMYQGQEIGFSTHPYESSFVFSKSQTISALDDDGLIPFYRDLAIIRQNYPALYSDNFEEVEVDPSNTTFAYRRWQGSENVFGVVSMRSANITVALELPVDRLELDSSKTYYLTDLLDGETFSGVPSELDTVRVPMARYTTRLLVLADSVVVTSVSEPTAGAREPRTFVLAQNYPNPFNPSTTIEFQLPVQSYVLLQVYDVLGREVATLVDEPRSQGVHRVEFHASGLASGMYFYRLQAGGRSLVGKMLLVR